MTYKANKFIQHGLQFGKKMQIEILKSPKYTFQMVYCFAGIELDKPECDILEFLMSYYIVALNVFFPVRSVLVYPNLDPFNMIRCVILQIIGLPNIQTQLVLLMLLHLYCLVLSKFMF